MLRDPISTNEHDRRHRIEFFRSIQPGQVGLEFSHLHGVAESVFGGYILPTSSEALVNQLGYTNIEMVRKVFSTDQEAFAWYKSAYERHLKAPLVLTPIPGLPEWSEFVDKLWYRLPKYPYHLWKHWFGPLNKNITIVEADKVLFEEIYRVVEPGIEYQITSGEGFNVGKYQVLDLDYSFRRHCKARLDRPVGRIGATGGTGYTDVWMTIFHDSELVLPSKDTKPAEPAVPQKPVPPLLRKRH